MPILWGLSKVGGTSVETSEIRRMNEAGEIPKNLKNPTLRDTVQVTGGGYTVWRFKADNPGILVLPLPRPNSHARGTVIDTECWRRWRFR